MPAKLTIDEHLRRAVAKAIKRGQTQGAIAAEAGVSRPVLMRFMDGTGGLRIDQAEAIAKAIGWRLALIRTK